MTNTVPKNVMNTASITVTSTVLRSSDSKKVSYKMNCYILHTVLLVTILLFIIALISFFSKKILTHYKIKIEKNEFKETCYYFHGIVNFEYFDFGNIWLDKNKYKIFLIYNIFDKALIGTKAFRIMFHKVDGFFKFFDGTEYLAFFSLENKNAIFDRIKISYRIKKWYYRYFFS